MVEAEINKFINEDDELANRLDRRSQSPTAHKIHKVGD